MPTDEDPMKLTNTVSSTGIFLQFLVKNELEKLNIKMRDRRANWDSQIEYPVRLSPFFRDPKDIGKNFSPEDNIKNINSCQIQNESEETRLDLVSTSDKIMDYPSKKVKFSLCIECKKLDPDYATWIFFKTKETVNMNLISKNTNSEGGITLLEIPETSEITQKIYIQLLKKWKLKSIRHVLCDSSVAVNPNETKKGKKDREYYKRDFDKIDNAARQIIKGTYGYILDKLNHQIASANEDYGFNNIIYFPIIVTTAELKIGTFDESKIDHTDGFLKEPLGMKNVDSLIYESGSSNSVRFPSPDFSRLDIGQKRDTAKWHVLIMSINGFKKFLNDLEEEKSLFLP